MGIEDRLADVDSLNLEAPNTETDASLILYADDIDIQAISMLLGCEPTEAYCRGAVIGKRRPAPIGLWRLDAPPKLPFPDKLQYLVETTTNDVGTWYKLAAKHRIYLKCVVFLRSWTDGFEFPAALLEEIGKRHWQFGLSVYSAEGDEIVDSFLRKNNTPQE